MGLQLLWLLLASAAAGFLFSGAVVSAWSDAPSAPHVVVVMGTRPDAIKLAPVVHALRSTLNGAVKTTVLCTGQHRELLRPVLDVFDIEPDVTLDTMQFGGNGSALFVARALELMSTTLRAMNPRPTALIVQGDTNTAFVGAMACFYERIPVIHVEAGLRTWDLQSPYPEEFNRRAISLISSLNLAPTPLAKDNLVRDGVSIDTVRVTGNTAIDSAMQILGSPAGQTGPDAVELNRINNFIQQYRGKYVLMSCHREETLSNGGINVVLEAVKRLAAAHTNTAFLFILHPNPRSRDPAVAQLQGISNVLLVDPLPYASLLRLLRSALLVASDSGGLQEEAAFLGTPMIVIRETTERVEGIRAGIARTSWLSVEGILEEVSNAMKSHSSLRKQSGNEALRSIYGDGKASSRIVCQISQFLGLLSSSAPSDLLPTFRGCEEERHRSEFKPPTPTRQEEASMPRYLDKINEQETAAAADLLSNFPLDTHTERLFPAKTVEGRITVMLTQYKRNTTEIQLRSIFSQTVFSKVDRIVIFQNEAHVDLGFLRHLDLSRCVIDSTPNPRQRKVPGALDDIIEIVSSPQCNYKYHGRFATALMFDTEFTAIFDDDTIPQPRWLEVAMETSTRLNAIVGPVGVIVSNDLQMYFNPPMNFELEVDYTGHSWVFKTEWLRHLWGSAVPSWEAGEDIGFSATAWMKARIRTVMPAMPLTAYEVWGDSVTRFHKDESATYVQPVPKLIRWPLTRYWIEQGWVPLVKRDSLIGYNTACAVPDMNCRIILEHILPAYFNGSRSFPSNFSSHVVKDIVMSKFVTKAANAMMIWFEDPTRPMNETEEAKVKRQSAARFYSHFPICGPKNNGFTDEDPSAARGGASRSKKAKHDNDNDNDRKTNRTKKRKSKRDRNRASSGDDL